MVHIYSVEGNIGSGKSTLVNILKDHYKNNKHILFLQEPVDIWETIKDKDNKNIIEKFYSDQSKYAFSFQMMAYISRLSILKKAVKENPDKIIICERSLFTDKNVFAKMLYDSNCIEEVNYQIYLKWFDEFISETPLSGIIYVKAEPEVSHSRVLKRSRQGEDIPLSYLQQCHTYHEEWLSNYKNILVLTANENKENINDYNEWINNINKFINIEQIMDYHKINSKNMSVFDYAAYAC